MKPGLRPYFILQLRLLCRQIRDFGISPLAGFLLGGLAFYGFLFFLFSRMEAAPWVCVTFALFLCSRLSESRRNDFLRSVFPRKDFLRLRILENLSVALPFLPVLLMKSVFYPAGVLLIIAPLFSLASFRTRIHITIPTPFYRRPFEFTVGFRNTFYLIFLAYLITAIAVKVGNFNLGIFALLVIFLVSFSFYSRPEEEYYVWSFNKTSRGFLFEKIRTGLLFTGLLALPVLTVLIAFFPASAGTVMLLFLLGCVYLIMVILAKYSAYPSQLNLPHSLLLAFSFVIPPLMLAVIPYFYMQSVRHLSPFLE